MASRAEASSPSAVQPELTRKQPTSPITLLVVAIFFSVVAGGVAAGLVVAHVLPPVTPISLFLAGLGLTEAVARPLSTALVVFGGALILSTMLVVLIVSTRSNKVVACPSPTNLTQNALQMLEFNCSQILHLLKDSEIGSDFSKISKRIQIKRTNTEVLITYCKPEQNRFFGSDRVEVLVLERPDGCLGLQRKYNPSTEHPMAEVTLLPYHVLNESTDARTTARTALHSLLTRKPDPNEHIIAVAAKNN